MQDQERELVLGLVNVLRQCAEPHAVASQLMAGLLVIVGEQSREMGRLLDDMEALARLENVTLPDADLAAARQEVSEMGRLRQHLELDHLFNADARQRCGRYAVPLLALALIRVGLWVDSASAWLDDARQLGARVDARLHHLRLRKAAADPTD